MIVVRFKVRCQPDKSEEAMAAFREVVTASRILDGVVSANLAVPDSLRVGLERFEAHPESAAAYGLVFAMRQIEALLKEGVDGIHLYALNKIEPVQAIAPLVGTSVLS